MGRDFLSELPHRVNPTEVGRWVHDMLAKEQVTDLDELLTCVKDELWVHSTSDSELDAWLAVAEGQWHDYFKE